MNKKNHFDSKEQYLQFRSSWRSFCQHKDKRFTLDPAHFLLYVVLRGKDVKRAFSLITNPRKLANGMGATAGLDRAREELQRIVRMASRGRPDYDEHVKARLAPFGGVVTVDLVKKAIGLVETQIIENPSVVELEGSDQAM